jgi:hypothetical protein
MDLRGGYAFEQRLTGDLTREPDAREALVAALERRPPRYAADGDDL